MANWSRALLSLGEGLGQLAQSVGQRQRDAMLMAREENLVRLRAQLEEQGNVTQFGRQKELIGMEDTAARERTGQAQAFETGMMARREQHDVTMSKRQETFQRERFSREDLQQLERSNAAEINQIDRRLSKINDEILKQRARDTANGTIPDETVLADRQAEIEQLQTAKSQLVQQRGETRANMGDPRYGKISPEEARRLGASSGLTARNTAKREGRTDAAQAPASKGSSVPVLGPKPQGMIDREARKARKVAPERSGVEQELSGMRQSGVDFKRLEHESNKKKRMTLLSSQSRLELEKLLRVGNISREDGAMIREILAKKSREETRRRMDEHKAAR